MSDLIIDTETTGLDWDRGHEPFMVQWRDDARGTDEIALLGPARGTVREHNLFRERRAWSPPFAFTELRQADRLVGHNLSFDIHMLRQAGIDLSDKRMADTKTLFQIVAPERRIAEDEDDRRGYRLKELARTYVDPHAADAEEELEALANQHGFRLKAKPDQQGYREAAYFELWKLEPEAMEHYAREDTRLTAGLLEAGEALLDEGTRRIWEIEQAVLPIIVRAEMRGIRVDKRKAALLRDEYHEQAQHLRDKLDAELPAGWNDNNEALAEALQYIGVPLTETTATGQVAVNKYALERQIDNHPILATLLEYRTAAKFVSTYLDHFIERDVIHPRFNAIGTWTGRMSGVQPNMQNIPVRAGTAVRELFVPREGMCFVGIDFEQIELRLLGYYLNDPALIERIENEDFFQWVAEQVGVDRTTAKNGTYAIVYGVGGIKLAKMFGWAPDSEYVARDWVCQRGYKQPGDPRSLRAETFIKQIKSILTGYWYLTKDRIEPQVQRTGVVTTVLGRRQWLGYGGGWKGLSGLVQGGAADIYKLAVTLAAAAVEPLGAYPLLFIHDEIVFEAPADAAEEVLTTAKAAMEEAMPGFRPRLAADGHIAFNNWGEAK